VGWSSVVPPYRWHFGAVATATAVAVALDGTAVRELCDSDPILGYQFTRALLTVLSRRLEAQQVSVRP
jgi:CRP/FNR family transcriptional regulator, cyclic AMP receptor protein